ncbi:MAG: hypothetical protein OEY19_13860 [Gammaproteobacteria bacterium]|nr:hypothetical protein [Gammaproteobacteria bacterium]MDH5630434.1 hypothetical protein [Gammaproteobacteria bacterium]
MNIHIRITIIFFVLFLGACSSARKYEDIIEDVLSTYQQDEITLYVNSWVPFDASDEFEINDDLKSQSERDQVFCMNEYRGQKFEDEAASVLFFMQCMNKRGWRLDTEMIIIISH